MVRVALLSSVLFLASACATQKSGSTNSAQLKNGVAFNQDSSSKKGPKVVCTMERELGTNIPERVCRTVDEDADRAQREQTQDALRGIQAGTAVKGN